MLLPDQSPAGSDGRDRLFDLAYRELSGIARGLMYHERRDHTLQPTALIHEAYLKLKRQKVFDWDDRTHFLALAAQAMRQVLVDLARRKQADKRRGQRVTWTVASIPQAEVLAPDDVLALNDALEKLAAQKPNGERHARLVECVWLAGMDFTESADLLGISRRQAHRDWAWARTWLALELSDG